MVEEEEEEEEEEEVGFTDVEVLRSRFEKNTNMQ
jgi:hypothetical protein